MESNKLTLSQAMKANANLYLYTLDIMFEGGGTLTA